MPFPAKLNGSFSTSITKYYATFLTNKGTNKRYLRYGKFRFILDGREYTIEIYKSILSDTLFIPFKDDTNEKETYEGEGILMRRSCQIIR